MIWRNKVFVNIVPNISVIRIWKFFFKKFKIGRGKIFNNLGFLSFIIFSTFISCKNYYNETIEWTDSLVIETDIVTVKKSQPDFVEIDWENPHILDGQEYYEIEIKNNRDILQMQNFLIFENDKYVGREAKK